MRRAALLLMTAGLICGQRYVEIKIPDGVDSNAVCIRYVLDRDFGGWVDPHSDISSYFISTVRNSRTAERLKALVYAPGCSIQTFDIAISKAWPQSISYDCRPVPSIAISGSVTGLDNARIEAKYGARWVREFFGLTDKIETPVPVGHGMYFAGSEGFRLSIPDFSGDDREGEIQFWAVDPGTGKILARLIPVTPRQPLVAGATIKFGLCGTPAARGHDRFGFAIRGHEDDIACKK